MHRLYENEDIVVFWDSDKCIHSFICWKSCPDAFDPKRKPWVRLDVAKNADVWQTIDKCPSGALSVVYKHEIEVLFEKDRCRSVALDGESEIGECEYAIEGDKWCIYHTGVREGYEGKKIAKRLVFKVLEEAERNGVKIDASCSYAKKVIEG